MTTAILSALPDEQTGLHALLDNPQSVQHAGRRFVQGRLHGHAVVLALSGIGKVAAATTATALVERFGAQRIVFTGVAGALASHVRVGDVVLGSAFMQHDMDVSPLFPRYVVPSYGHAQFSADDTLNASLFIAINDYIEAAKAQIAHAFRSPNVHAGLMVSGDQFIGSTTEVHRLRAELPQALCVEMESAAVAQVCHDYAIPFAAIRTLSDRADDDAHIDFAEFIQTVAGPYAVGIIGQWFKNQSLYAT